MASASVLALALGCGDDDGRSDGGTRDLGRADAGEADGGGIDGGGATDVGGEDAGGEVDAGGTDAGPSDAGEPVDLGPLCEGNTFGACTETGTGCECCPAGGPLSNCLCTTTCTTDADCPEPSRPLCNKDMLNPGATGICTPNDFVCAWGAICAAPDTPIATPEGDRAIGALVPGDLVYSVEGDAVVVVPILRVAQTSIDDHRVVRIRLDGGDELLLSPGHPTADGGLVGNLRPGDVLGDRTVEEATLVPYEYPSTHDILPASPSGTYFAAGALVGSSLR